MGEHCKKCCFFFDILVSLGKQRFVQTKGNNRKSIPLKERSSVPISKLTKGAYEIHQKGQASMKTIKKGLASGNRGRAPAPIQNLLQGRLDKWVLHLQKIDTLSMIGIQNKYFQFIPVIMVLYTYKYQIKMLKR